MTLVIGRDGKSLYLSCTYQDLSISKGNKTTAYTIWQSLARAHIPRVFIPKLRRYIYKVFSTRKSGPFQINKMLKNVVLYKNRGFGATIGRRKRFGWHLLIIISNNRHRNSKGTLTLSSFLPTWSHPLVLSLFLSFDCLQWRTIFALVVRRLLLPLVIAEARWEGCVAAAKRFAVGNTLWHRLVHRFRQK